MFRFDIFKIFYQMETIIEEEVTICTGTNNILNCIQMDLSSEDECKFMGKTLSRAQLEMIYKHYYGFSNQNKPKKQQWKNKSELCIQVKNILMEIMKDLVADSNTCVAQLKKIKKDQLEQIANMFNLKLDFKKPKSEICKVIQNAVSKFISSGTPKKIKNLKSKLSDLNPAASNWIDKTQSFGDKYNKLDPRYRTNAAWGWLQGVVGDIKQAGQDILQSGKNIGQGILDVGKGVGKVGVGAAKLAAAPVLGTGYLGYKAGEAAYNATKAIKETLPSLKQNFLNKYQDENDMKSNQMKEIKNMKDMKSNRKKEEVRFISKSKPKPKSLVRVPTPFQSSPNKKRSAESIIKMYSKNQNSKQEEQLPKLQLPKLQVSMKKSVSKTKIVSNQQNKNIPISEILKANKSRGIKRSSRISKLLNTKK